MSWILFDLAVSMLEIHALCIMKLSEGAVRMKLPWITVFFFFFLSIGIDCYFRRYVLICRILVV